MRILVEIVSKGEKSTIDSRHNKGLTNKSADICKNVLEYHSQTADKDSHEHPKRVPLPCCYLQDIDLFLD